MGDFGLPSSGAEGWAPAEIGCVAKRDMLYLPGKLMYSCAPMEPFVGSELQLGGDPVSELLARCQWRLHDRIWCLESAAWALSFGGEVSPSAGGASNCSFAVHSPSHHPPFPLCDDTQHPAVQCLPSVLSLCHPIPIRTAARESPGSRVVEPHSLCPIRLRLAP